MELKPKVGDQLRNKRTIAAELDIEHFVIDDIEQDVGGIGKEYFLPVPYPGHEQEYRESNQGHEGKLPQVTALHIVQELIYQFLQVLPSTDRDWRVLENKCPAVFRPAS